MIRAFCPGGSKLLLLVATSLIFATIVTAFWSQPAYADSPIEVRVHPNCATTRLDCQLDGTKLIVQHPSTPAVEIPIRGKEAFLHGEPGEEVSLELRSDDYWMEPYQYTFSETSPTEIEIDVWPLTGLRGRLRTRSGNDAGRMRLPALVIRTETSPGRERSAPLPRGTEFRCVVGKVWFECRVPVEELSFVLEMEGFARMYVWNPPLERDRMTDLGTLSLVPGASITGWIDPSVVAAATQGKVHTMLYSLTTAIPGSGMAPRSQRPLRTSPDRRGQFQFTGLEEGVFTLEVEADGHATRFVSPLTTYPGKETAIRRLIELFPPIDFDVDVSPVADPHGEPWNVEIWALSAITGRPGDERVFQGSLQGGSVRISDQSPGLYKITVSSSAGDRFATRQVRVDDHLSSVSIDLDLVSIEGRLTFGGQPSAGEIYFGTRSGNPRIHPTADREGKFSATLPRRETWPVEIVIGDVSSLQSVTMDGELIEIDVPDRELAGVVLDPRGRAVAGAHIVVGSGTGIARVQRSDLRGHFLIRGLPSKIDLTARDPRTGLSSGPVQFDLDIVGEEMQEIHLRPAREVDGRVESQSRPVMGAVVMIYSMRGSSSLLISKTNTDETGAFEALIDPNAEGLNIVVHAPGHTLEVIRAVPNRELRIELDRIGGTATLHFPEQFDQLTAFVDDGFIPGQTLFSWSMHHGLPLEKSGPLILPNLAPANYRFCFRNLGDEMCRAGRIVPYGEIELSFASDD